MRLVVLGSGTCVPSGTRLPSGYWVEAGPARVRLDCGAGTVHAMARWGLPWDTLTHQFVSHFHLDHVGELPFLCFSLRYGRAGRPRSSPFTIAGPAGLRALVEDLERVLRQQLLEQEFPTDVRELAPGEALDLGGGATLRVARAPHTAESLAVRIEAGGASLGYTGDTAPSDDLAAFFRGVDVLIAECSFLDGDKKTPHLTANDAASLASAARAKRLVATHCYFDPEEADLGARLAEGFGGEITVATDGLSLWF
jgi:ribonuclease BN (tRNA processing enzyme)